MSMDAKLRRAILLTFALCVTTVSLGQSREPLESSLGPLSAEPRFFAPFSAKAVTRVVQRTQGRRMDRTTVSTYYRDSFGRVRVEYELNAAAGDGAQKGVLLIPNPYARTDRVFRVDDDAKLVEVGDSRLLASRFSATKEFTIPTGLRRFTDFFTIELRVSGAGLFEDLGSRTIGGVQANGMRFTPSAWPGVDERWESADLGLVVRAREVDMERGWEIDYALTDIRVTEPRSDLFVMPAGYQYGPGVPWSFESPEYEIGRLTGKW